MKQNLLLCYFSTILAFFLTSCATQKPIGDVTFPDYNRRIKVNNAKLEKKTSAFGHLFKVGSTGGAAYYGYKENFIELEREDGTIYRNEYVSAAAAGLLGIIVSSIGVNFATSGDPIQNVGEDNGKIKKWIQKYNNEYKIIPNSQSYNEFEMI